MQAVYALGFWYGGGLVASGEMNLKDMLKVFFAILLAAMGIAQVSRFTLTIEDGTTLPHLGVWEQQH